MYKTTDHVSSLDWNDNIFALPKAFRSFSLLRRSSLRRLLICCPAFQLHTLNHRHNDLQTRNGNVRHSRKNLRWTHFTPEQVVILTDHNRPCRLCCDLEEQVPDVWLFGYFQRRSVPVKNLLPSNIALKFLKKLICLTWPTIMSLLRLNLTKRVTEHAVL